MKKFKRISAVLLAVVLVLSMGVSALAANDALIDTTKPGSITIHKFDGTGGSGADEFGIAGDGTAIDTTDFGNPLNGIVFTITLLPNANTSTTLAEAQQMVVDEALSVTATGTTGSGSNDDGEYVFGNLTHGIYLVQEQTNSAVDTSVEPFLVSIPMTDPTNSSKWMYDVNVYPKNDLKDLSLTKEIRTADGDTDAAAADIGDTVEWVIKASIPVDISQIDLANGYFYIDDTLDSRLNYVSTAVTLVDSTSAVKYTFTDGDDFTLTEPTASGDGYIKVDFNETDGIAELTNALANGWTIEILVTATINETAVMDLNESISNGAGLHYKNDIDDPVKTVEIEPEDAAAPEVSLTGLALHKTDKTAGTALNNAVFTIYTSLTNAQEGTAIQVSSADWTEETGVCVIGGVIAKEGYIYFSQADLMTALGYDPTDSTSVAAFGAAYSSFYLVETTEPEGYELLNEVIKVDLGTTASAENVKLSDNPGFTLPITGGSGTLLFTIIGIVLIGGAVTLLLVSRKKKNSSSK